MSDDGGLRGLFRAHLPDFHWQSIETGGTGRGIPDSNFCRDGAEGWIEFKQTDGYVAALRTGQIGWLERRARAGGAVFVGVRRWHDGGARRGAAVDELWLLAGAAAGFVRTNGLRREARYVLGVWENGPARWDWWKIGSILVRR